jgi:uroporphyrinogen III methyltransferase/synthase
MATALGAEVSSVPLIKTVEVVPEALTRELLIGENGDWLVFSSAVAVRLWHGLLRRHRIDGRLLAGRRLAVVGPETARRLEDLAGLTADLIATPARQQGLVAGLTAMHSRGGRAVWFTGDRADRNLETELGHAGWSVCRVEVYRTEVDRDQATKLAELLAQGQRNTVVFSSGSAVEALEAAWQHIRPREVPNFRVVTIGPVTSERVRAAGWKVDAEAESPGASGLCAALLRAWSGDHGGN